METSTLNGANGMRAQGIVPLSMNEIDLVAGGKANQPTGKSFWDRVLDWVNGWSSFGGGSSPPVQTQPMANPGPEFLSACLDAGGSFTWEYSSGGGSAVLAIMSANGSGTTLRITCTPP